MSRPITLDEIAMVCHEVNRAYCSALGDDSQLPWLDAPVWQRVSARMGVDAHLMTDLTPEQSHALWCALKESDGWVYGPVKDVDAKTHPCVVPYANLSTEQKAKDHIFKAIVDALSGMREDFP